MGRLRGVTETLRANAENSARAHREAQEQVGELAAQLSAARDAERREREANIAANELLAAAKAELSRFQDAPPPPPDPRLDELRKELLLLRTQNKCKFINKIPRRFKRIFFLFTIKYIDSRGRSRYIIDDYIGEVVK